MADEAKPKKLTLGEAIKDLGWFPLLFAVGVGGPSILVVLEQVMVNHQLVPALRWIVDGYQRVMAVLGASVEPWVRPAIDWVNTRLGWSMTLNPVWRPIFALSMVFVMATVRTAIRAGSVGGAVTGGGALSIGSLATALLIGLFAAGPGWLAQGAVAALPFAMFVLVLAAIDAAERDWRGFFSPVTGFVTLFVFVLGAGLSFVPGLAQSGGLLVFGAVIALLGAGLLAEGLRGGNRDLTRAGLTILGGFVAAGLILIADFAVTALG